MKKFNDGIEDLANKFGNKIKNSLDDSADGVGSRFDHDGPGGHIKNRSVNDNQPVVKNKQQIEYMEAIEDAEWL